MKRLLNDVTLFIADSDLVIGRILDVIDLLVDGLLCSMHDADSPLVS